MLCEQGYYKGVVTGATATESGQNKTPTLAVTVLVESMQQADGNVRLDPPVERTVFLYFSESARPYSVQKLKRLGFNGDFDNPLFSDEAGTEGVGLQCKHDNYNGEVKEKWDFAGGGWKPEKAATATVSKLNALWRSTAGTTPPPAARKAAPPPPAKPSSNGTTATATAVKPATRDEAWGAVVEMAEAKGGDANGLWSVAIEKVEASSKRAEASFTTADYGRVVLEAELADIPF